MKHQRRTRRKAAAEFSAADRAHNEQRRLAMWKLPTIPTEDGAFLLSLPRSTYFRLLREHEITRKKLGRHSHVDPDELRRKLLAEATP